MDYYKILGVVESSSIEEIKKAYHKKAHENHPDKGGNDLEMKLINNAYHELLKIKKIPIKYVHQVNPDRPISKCKTCGKDTYYTLCLDCWIKLKREEKKQRIHNIHSFMFCLNCNKSLYHRRPITVFCDDKCSKEYYKKRGKIKIKKPCSHENCLSEEDAYRLKRIDIEKVLNLKYKERIAIFTRLIGKNKALWFDTMVNKEFRKD